MRQPLTLWVVVLAVFLFLWPSTCHAASPSWNPRSWSVTPSKLMRPFRKSSSSKDTSGYGVPANDEFAYLSPARPPPGPPPPRVEMAGGYARPADAIRDQVRGPPAPNKRPAPARGPPLSYRAGSGDRDSGLGSNSASSSPDRSPPSRHRPSRGPAPWLQGPPRGMTRFPPPTEPPPPPPRQRDPSPRYWPKQTGNQPIYAVPMKLASRPDPPSMNHYESVNYRPGGPARRQSNPPSRNMYAGVDPRRLRQSSGLQQWRQPPAGSGYGRIHREGVYGGRPRNDHYAEISDYHQYSQPMSRQEPRRDPWPGSKLPRNQQEQPYARVDYAAMRNRRR